MPAQLRTHAHWCTPLADNLGAHCRAYVRDVARTYAPPFVPAPGAHPAYVRFNECTRSGPRPVQYVVRASNPLDAERRQMLHEAEARG